MAYEKTLQQYADELIAQGDKYGQQLLDEFGDGNGVYENEYGIPHVPSDYFYGSSKKIQWTCREKGHKWKTKICERASHDKTGCPFCNKFGTSYPEQFIYWSFKQLYTSTENRKLLFKSEERTHGYEYDIYIPELSTVIEYSGANWHKEKEESDRKKKELALSNNLRFIEIIENSAKDNMETYSPDYICCNKKQRDIKKIVDYLFKQFNHSISEIDTEEIESLAREYSQGKIEYKKSLEYLEPELLKEWDFEKNKLLPSQVTIGSSYKAWWKCKKGHSWKARIWERACHDKTGCPFCSGNQRIQIPIGQFAL